MAVHTPDTVSALSESYGSATAGQTPTVITPAGGGDSIALQGSLVCLRFETTGTAAVITLDSVELSSHGQDTNVVVTMPATGIRYVFVKADARFKQTSGNVGHLNLSYDSVTGLSIEAWSVA